MARRDRAVERALNRWTGKGLLDAPLAERLRDEAREDHDARTLRAGQLLFAVAGATALFLAGALFVSESWPLLSERVRTVALAGAACAVWVGGRALAGQGRWRRIGEVLQVAALALGAFALVYSEAGWAPGSVGQRVIGVLGLAVPVALARTAWRGSPGLVAAHTAFALIYAALFFGRTFELPARTIVWLLDGLLALALVVVGLRLRRRREAGTTRELAALVTGSWAGLVLIGLTGALTFGWGEGTAWALDLWWLGLTALTLWWAARAPAESDRHRIETHMAALVPLGTVLIGYSVGEVLSWPVLAASAAAGVVAAGGLWWGLRARNLPTAVASTAALIAVLWTHAVMQSHPLLGVATMAATAALLFIVAARIRARA